jgi:hypothetical protein
MKTLNFKHALTLIYGLARLLSTGSPIVTHEDGAAGLPACLQGRF